MAVLNLASGGSDKENAPPPSTSRGIAVRKPSAMKRSKPALRRRPPLRDITCLFVTASRPVPSPAFPPPRRPDEEEEPAVVPDAAAAALAPEGARALAGALSCGVATEQGRFALSLRKGFR